MRCVTPLWHRLYAGAHVRASLCKVVVATNALFCTRLRVFASVCNCGRLRFKSFQPDSFCPTLKCSGALVRRIHRVARHSCRQSRSVRISARPACCRSGPRAAHPVFAPRCLIERLSHQLARYSAAPVFRFDGHRADVAEPFDRRPGAPVFACLGEHCYADRFSIVLGKEQRRRWN